MARTAVKKVKNAVLYDDGMIRISNVRFSYPHLKKKYKGDGDQGEGAFGVVGLMPKDTHKAAKKLIEERIEELLKENKIKSLASDKKFLRDGDDSGKDENEGCWTVSARETKRPSLRQYIDEDNPNEPVEIDDVDEVFYGGCWGSILIRPWFQNNKYGKRVNAGLAAAKKRRDDEAFGEGRISEEDVDEAFDEEDEDEDDTPRRKPSSRRSRDDDDEDEEERRPARRRRSRDDDDDDL